ncbi:NUDIX domain-containing protein [Prolixibacteraceae bacterium Z1-6]|uniref:NUDIX domain-containing protein n=1 Tax=Draconibacterium aestuarii TaxID=2998507 RepID=A0A9X3F5X4_9BACT|nr:NUDIX domain-containing protein [Prolixibacteraceae bacterium Z1-6]
MQKYKVFFNEKRIVFTSTRKITLRKPRLSFLDDPSTDSVLRWVETFVEGDITEAVIEHKSTDDLFNAFRLAFTEIDAAGGVVVRNNKLLFIFRNGKWDLPKGKIDDGETADVAAIREVEEECGISGHRIVKQLPSTFHIYKSPYKDNFGTWIFKETFWYEMGYTGELEGKPQLDEGISEVRWFAKNELHEVLENTYENLKQIIELYMD